MSVNKEIHSSLAGRLAEQVGRLAKPESAAWLQARIALAGTPAGRSELPLSFASAGRRLGTASFSIDASREGSTPRPGDAHALDAQLAPLAGKGLDEAGRVALLLASVGEGDDVARVTELYLRGDAREKQAVLLALPFLPGAERFVELAVEAVRSSVQTVFEAIACENPFPAAWFSDAAFNQVVLKALFNEVRTQRIVGLEQRAGAELLRMVDGYAAERRAAGRSVPIDIESIKSFALARRA